MAAKKRYTLRSWMLVYLSLAAALAAAVGEREAPTDVLGISAAPGPAAVSEDTVFFAPVGDVVRRNDI